MHTQQAERFMSNTLARLCIDERGIETLEWLAVAVLILIVAFAIFPVLQTGLTTVVNNITTALTSSVPAGGS
jgi:Flp pilus assembly pilin Flp